MTRFDSPRRRLALRILYYIAVLVAVAVVNGGARHIPAGFAYQAF